MTEHKSNTSDYVIIEHKSSHIKTSRWQIDEPNNLIVEFHNGGIYSYDGVTQSDYESFVNHESPGKGFSLHIRKYAGTKMGSI